MTTALKPNYGSCFINRQNLALRTTQRILRRGLASNGTVIELGEALALFDDRRGYSDAVTCFNEGHYKAAHKWLLTMAKETGLK